THRPPSSPLFPYTTLFRSRNERMRKRPGRLTRLEMNQRPRNAEMLADMPGKKSQRGSQNEVGALTGVRTFRQQPLRHRPQNPPESTEELHRIAPAREQLLAGVRFEDLRGVGRQRRELQPRRDHHGRVPRTRHQPHLVAPPPQCPPERHARLNVTPRPRREDHDPAHAALLPGVAPRFAPRLVHRLVLRHVGLVPPLRRRRPHLALPRPPGSGRPGTRAPGHRATGGPGPRPTRTSGVPGRLDALAPGVTGLPVAAVAGHPPVLSGAPGLGAPDHAPHTPANAGPGLIDLRGAAPGLPFTVVHPGRSTVTDTPRDPAWPAASGADTFMPVTMSRGYAFMAALLAFLRQVVTARTFSALVGPGVVFVEAGGLPGGGACGRGLRAVGQGLLVLFPPALPPRRRSWNGGGNRKIVLRPPGVGGRPSWAGRGRGQGIAGPWFRRGFRGRVVAFGAGARWCVGVRRRQGVSGEGSVVGGAGRAGLGRVPGVPGAGREEGVFGAFGRLGAEFGGARARRGLG